jgi:hypothetical protein
MKTAQLALVLVTVVVMFGSFAHADAWQTIYSTDFSSDPGWITNDPSRYFWNSGTHDYAVKPVILSTGGYYGVHDVGSNPGSFRFTYDIKPLQCDWAGTINFGLFGTNLEVSGNCVYIRFLNDTAGGLHPHMYADNGVGCQEINDYGHNFSLGTWYHVEAEYDSLSQNLLANLTYRDTGVYFTSMSLPNVGPFSPDMTWLGSSNYTSGANSPSYFGAQGIGTIDNVTFEVVPEPATFSLLFLGGLALIRRRK